MELASEGRVPGQAVTQRFIQELEAAWVSGSRASLGFVFGSCKAMLLPAARAPSVASTSSTGLRSQTRRSSSSST